MKSHCISNLMVLTTAFLKSAFVYKKGIAIELLITEYRYDYALDPIQK